MQTNSTSPPPPPQQASTSGEALYNSIMGQIEPELTFPVIAQLEECFKNDTSEERTARGARYRAAFAKYEELYAAVHSTMSGETTSYCRSALEFIKALWKGKDDDSLGELEKQINALPA